MSYGTLLRIGDTTNDALDLVYNAATGVAPSFSYVTFDTCGRVYVYEVPVDSSGWSFDHCVFKNTNAAQNPGANNHVEPLYLRGSATPAGTRAVTNCTFDKPPWLIGNGTTYSGNWFREGWDDAGSSAAWAGFSNSFIRLIATDGQNSSGGISNSYILMDTWPLSSLSSGAATSATSTTLVDSGKTWTAHAYQSSGAVNYFVQITGGTGAGQMRTLNDNTATTLTVSYAWSTTPDTSSTYAIYQGLVNAHHVNIFPSGATYTGNVLEFTGADANGDGWLGYPAGVATFTNNVFLPNGAFDNSATFMTLGTASGVDIRVSHNTWYAGSQTASVEDYTASAEMITLFKSNLVWTQNSGPSSALGPYKVADTAHPGSGGLQDIVAPASADYNACWNCLAGNYLDNGYNINLSSAAGSHDVNMSGGTGPAFLDPTRNFANWAKSLGASGTMPQDYIANGLNAMQSGNSGYTIPALMNWVTAGFAPSNGALKGTAHDGGDIGAVAVQSSGPIRPRRMVIWR